MNRVTVKEILAVFGLGACLILTALPVHAQEVATLVLRDGQRPSGELVDLNASGFTLRVGGRDQQYSANDVVAVEFVGGGAPAEARARIDAGQSVIVLRNGQVVDGRLFDVGGTHPLRLTVQMPGGMRDYTSNDVAQIYLGAPVRGTSQPPAAPQDQNIQQRGQQGQQGQEDQKAVPRGQQKKQDQKAQPPGQQKKQQDQRAQPRGQQQRQQQDRDATQQENRVTRQRQQQLVDQQEQRLAQYRQDLDRQQRLAQQQAEQLQQQRRSEQYRVQRAYLERLRQQQEFLQNDRHPDYERDPYFYTAPTYRYSRDGRDSETNEYGADLLRQAVNTGYEQGFLAGDADRRDRWRGDYRDSYAYQDANYGYNGYYVDRDDYNYYFREGFRRGYEDGWNARSQYGRNVNGSHSMLEEILAQVLRFVPLR